MLKTTLRKTVLLIAASGLLGSCDLISEAFEALETAEVQEFVFHAQNAGVSWRELESEGRCDRVPLRGSLVERSLLPELRRTEGAGFVSAAGYELQVSAFETCTRRELYLFQAVLRFDTSALPTRFVRQASLELEELAIEPVGAAASANREQCLGAATVGRLVQLPRQPLRRGPRPAAAMLRGPAEVAGATPVDGDRADVTESMRSRATDFSFVVSPGIPAVRAQAQSRDREDQALLCARALAGATLRVQVLVPRPAP